MGDSNKRKGRPNGGQDGQDGRDAKRSKRGSGGKWQTPHHKAKLVSRGSGRIEPGDMGIWITCARGQEGRATEELKGMFEECAERFYGIRSDPDDEGEDASVDDIEASIQKEIASLGDKNASTKLFSPVHLDLQCVLFFKTRSPIDPVDFVHRICEDIVTTPGTRKMKYANRLTPMTLIGKATENGLEELGNVVLGSKFNLAGAEAVTETAEKKPDTTYAIRPTIRNHSTLNRDTVIKQVASMIDDGHKVNLTAPDQTIILELYQTICGMSVVGSDWDKLKRYNLAELYSAQNKPHSNGKEATETKPKVKDETNLAQESQQY